MDVNAIHTIKGLELKAKLETGVRLDITRIVAGTGRSSDLAVLESISDIRQEITITGKFRRGTQSIIFAVLSNKGLTVGYDLTQIGVFANDPDEGEILYRVAELKNAFPISAEKDFPNFSIDCTFTDNVSNASEVHVVVDPAGMVTASQFEVVQALAQEALAAAHESGGIREIISLTPPDSRECDVWLKPIGSISANGEISGGGGTVPLYLQGAFRGTVPPEDTGMLWVKPATT